jgi:hypothetical protein
VRKASTRVRAFVPAAAFNHSATIKASVRAIDRIRARESGGATSFMNFALVLVVNDNLLCITT